MIITFPGFRPGSFWLLRLPVEATCLSSIEKRRNFFNRARRNFTLWPLSCHKYHQKSNRWYFATKMHRVCTVENTVLMMPHKGFHEVWTIFVIQSTVRWISWNVLQITKLHMMSELAHYLWNSVEDKNMKLVVRKSSFIAYCSFEGENCGLSCTYDDLQRGLRTLYINSENFLQSFWIIITIFPNFPFLVKKFFRGHLKNV